MGSLSEKQKYELKKFIKELRKHRGRHTELVSAYIPSGYDMNKIINHLSQEQGTAVNIKSTSTRKNVIDALERIIQHLRSNYTQTPPNGLAAFSGNVAEREGQSDVRVWSIEPPVALKIRLYRCDKTFVIDILENMLEIKEVYGLIVLDRRDANIALLKGKTIIPLVKTHSQVPGKYKAGGQCIHPDTIIKIPSGETKLDNLKKSDLVKSFNFEENSLEESEVLDFWEVKKDKYLIIKTKNHEIIASKEHLFFVDKNSTKTAEELTKSDLLLDENGEKLKIESIEQKNKEISLIDLSVRNQNFIANGLLVHNSAPRFARLREGAAKDHYKKVADYMKEQFLGNKNLKGIIVGGPGPTKYDFVEGNFITSELKQKIIAIKDLGYTEEFGLQELLDKSEDVLAQEEVSNEKRLMQRFFNLLSIKQNMVAYGETDVLNKLKMGAVDILLLSEALEDEKIELFEKEAEALGSEVKIVSTETREGVQLREMGKIAAILRYEVHQ